MGFRVLRSDVTQRLIMDLLLLMLGISGMFRKQKQMSQKESQYMSCHGTGGSQSDLEVKNYETYKRGAWVQLIAK